MHFTKKEKEIIKMKNILKFLSIDGNATIGNKLLLLNVKPYERLEKILTRYKAK